MIEITIAEMFDMISEFADELLQHVNRDDARKETMVEASRKMLEVFKTMDLEGRAAIIVMLHGACAMYEVAVENMESHPPCPPQHLN